VTQTREERAAKHATSDRARRAANPEYKAKEAAYRRNHRAANPGKEAAYQRAWRAANREKVAARYLAYCTANPGKQAARWRAWKYNLTPEAYEAMLAAQSGRCAICRETMIPPCVDHNHTTGAIRELLCHRCNRVGGTVSDDPVLLRLAADYLERHSAVTPKATA
jgi:hypothetical protein